jgi:two-component system chemotaxis response regulator CheY
MCVDAELGEPIAALNKLHLSYLKFAARCPLSLAAKRLPPTRRKGSPKAAAIVNQSTNHGCRARMGLLPRGGVRDVKTIMLVDDSATVLLSISGILAKAGFQVVTASSAEDGQKKLASGTKPDLLITDLNMPGMNGIEFIKVVRQRPELRFMPILFLTTESQQSKRAEAKAAGASGWIVKPATADTLLNTIMLVLR